MTRDILRVDHAGECGAIRIYRAQLAVARQVAPDLVPMLHEALGDECGHRDAFAAAMRERDFMPCNLLPLWGVGGSILGGVTALLGRNAILVCTEAVERTVHRHMNDQIDWLTSRDVGLSRKIAAIRDQEIEHLQSAVVARGATSGFGLRLLDQVVAAATELLVWTSTYGASSRMGRLEG